MMKVVKVNEELIRLFKKANEHFYNNKLPENQIEITIQRTERSNALGWFTLHKVWKDQSGDQKYEINISAEYLNFLGYQRVVTTLLHEMAHFYNCVNGIKDVSGHQYHNKKFKKTAEENGLTVEQVNGYGHAKTKLNEEGLKWLESVGVKKELFSIQRGELINIQDGEQNLNGEDESEEEQDKPKREKKGSKLKKWSCKCGVNVRVAVTDFEATCNKCDTRFELQD